VIGLGLVIGATATLATTSFAPADAPARHAATLDGTLTCKVGDTCVYTLRNTGTQTSYVSYGNTAFPWGDAHFAGGGCLKPGQTLTEVAYTHNGHGIPRAAGSSVSEAFSLPYMPLDNRCR
jgi:hypothetical protein